MTSPRPWKQLVGCFIGLSAALGSLGMFSATACDTPVYRYAMYRWEPAPYEIYYFHEDPISEQAAKLHEQIETAARSEENPANVMFVPVPLKEDTELKRIPPDVKAAWTKQEKPVIPSYMVVSPHGGQLHSGDLDETTVKALLNSQARTDIAKQLEEGKACVMVLVTGTDKAANAEAEKAIKTLFKDIADGEIELYVMPPAYGFSQDEQPEPPKIEFGYVKVERDDPQEKWLVEFLLSLEPDLKDEEFVDQAMVFGIFGRGRALPPFIGKGINPDNLLDCVDFVTGACSCTVKDQNPGMDLLFTKDWWTAAENLANAFGAEEGNEPQYGAADFFPQLMIPGGEEDASDTPEASGDAVMQVAAAQDQDPPPGEPAPSPKKPTEEAEQEEGSKPDQEPAEEVTPEAKPAEKDSAQEQPEGKEAVDEDPDATEADEPESATEPSAEEPDAETESEPADGAVEDAEMDDVGTETIIAVDEEEVGEDEVEEESADQPSESAHTDSHTTSVESSHGAGHELEPTGTVGIMAVGAGIAISLLLLFALTFVVLRPK